MSLIDEEELRKRGYDYLDKCTKRQGFVIIPNFVRAQLVDMYVAGALDNSRWHYPASGEYPTEQNYYFVAVKPSFEGADMIVSLYTYFPREKKWIDKWGYSCREVYAWMPVPEPPKEEA